MKKYLISLSNINKVQEFVRCISHIDCDFDIEIGRHVIDAKSVLGIYSLDLSKPLPLIANTEDEDTLEKINDVIKPFAIACN